MSPALATAAVVAVLTLLRLGMAAVVPLAPDETYYWVWSHALAFGYLDHPPMVALWIKGGTALLGQTPLGVRLFGPLAAALASWFLYDGACRLFPGRSTGAAAALLMNGTLFLGVGTVVMTPDSPLLFFWTAALWTMTRLISGGGGGWWLAAGLSSGLALDSKYTGLFLWIGIGLWTLLLPQGRLWLRRWQPWAAVALGFALFAPVLWWNAAHGWAGFVKQGGRVDDWRPARAVEFLGELVGSQIGLATPWICGLCVTGLVVAARRSWTTRDPRWSLLLALSLPPVLVFLQHALGDRVQGNWPAIIYPALAVAAAGWLAAKRDGAWIGAVSLGLAITAIVYAQAATGLMPLPARADPIALRLEGWDGLARQVNAVRLRAGADYVTADGYAPGSELAWWLPADVPVVGIGQRWALTDLPTAAIAGKAGLLLRDARQTNPPDPAIWATAERLTTVNRFGAPSRMAIYRVRATASAPPAVALPARR